jgi:hypothetical protein
LGGPALPKSDVFDPGLESYSIPEDLLPPAVEIVDPNGSNLKRQGR